VRLPRSSSAAEIPARELARFAHETTVVLSLFAQNTTHVASENRTIRLVARATGAENVLVNLE
jgi:hypothetical protein